MYADTEFGATIGLMDVDAVQRTLNRSRASVYRYANTDLEQLNPPFDPKKLNPELRQSPNDPLMFHSNEVARFARDVLKIKQVTIEIQDPQPNRTQEVLEEILIELKGIRELLESRST